MKAWLKQNRAIFGVIGLILIVLSSFAYAMFQGGFVSWFLFYSVVPMIGYSFFISFYRLHHLKVTRELKKDSMLAGDDLLVTIHVKSYFPIPLFFLIVRDMLPEVLGSYAKVEGRLYQSGSQAILFPLFKRNISYTYKLSGVPRGVYELEKISLYSGDLFGFLFKEIFKRDPRTIFVYPRYQDIHSWSLYETQPTGKNRSGQKNSNDFSQAVSVRDYVPGDRMSWIHWKATARKSKLITKNFEIQQSDDLVIFLDRSKQLYRSHGDPAFEKAISLAASLIKNSVDKGTPLSFHSVGKDYVEFLMGTGKQFEADIFYHLAKTKADGEKSLPATIQSNLHKIPKGSTVIIISSDLSNLFTKQLGELISDRIHISYCYIPPSPYLDPNAYAAFSKLGRQQVDVRPIQGDNFNEALKAGVWDATS
jgi:uncharacterized protein (DUF58 family)